MVNSGHESLFPRFTATSAARNRCRTEPIRGGRDVRRLAGLDQTLSQTTTRDRSCLAKAIPGRPAKKGAVLQAHLRAQLEAHPDATREEHCRLFQAEHGIDVSTASISRARVALGWTRKKPSGQRIQGRGCARLRETCWSKGEKEKGHETRPKLCERNTTLVSTGRT